MWKKFLVVMIGFFSVIGFALAEVEVNKADQVALDGLKGIGPAKSKAIIEERTKNGPFKDWSDFQSRVKGVGDVLSTKLSEAGLTVNGAPKPASEKTARKEKGKPASDNTKTKAVEAVTQSKEKEAAQSTDKKEAVAKK